MVGNGTDSAKHLKGFEIECLLWNVPNELFSGKTWYELIQNVIRYLWQNTSRPEMCQEWVEVSALKWLFKYEPAIKRERAHRFINDAWGLIGLPQ